MSAKVDHHHFATAAFTVSSNNCTAFPQSATLPKPSVASFLVIAVISGGNKHAL